MEGQDLFECNLCQKAFQRKAHLIRHQQQHSGARPYTCVFCPKTFKRSDVLRDHFSRCALRGDNPIPQSLERGRKRHACDDCSRLKVKCDNQAPCSKCREFGRVCRSSRPKTRTSTFSTYGSTKASTSPPPSLRLSQSLTPASTTPEPTSDRNSIGFLLNCADDKEILREFPQSSAGSPPNPALTLSPPRLSIEAWRGNIMNQSVTSLGYSADMDIDSNQDAESLSKLEFETFERETHGWEFPPETPVAWTKSNGLIIDRNLLVARSFDIREKLRYAATVHYAPKPLPKDIIEGIDIIRADAIAVWTKLYFKHWHHHAPLVHEASYNPVTAALPLVLSVMCVGAMYAKDNSLAGDESTKLKCLLDVIESYIYSIPGFSDEYDNVPERAYSKRRENSSQEWQQYQLEEFQGAYLVVVLQYWAGNETAKSRVRQQRFSRLTAIYRELGLQCVQHTPGFMIKNQTSFRTWIREECYIRTSTLMMMLDNRFALFNNLAPRLQWAEIDLPFPSDDLYFKAFNYDDLSHHSGFPISKMKIKDAFILLFSPMDTAEKDLVPLRGGALSILDMQMLIHALYVHIWNGTYCNPLSNMPGISIPSICAPYKIALRNWKLVWDEIRATVRDDDWNKLGFQRTAEDYYDTVRRVVSAFEATNGRYPAFPSDCPNGDHLKRLLSF